MLIKGYSLIIEQVRNNRGAAQSGNIQNGIVDILLIPIIKEIEANELPTMADAVKIDFLVTGERLDLLNEIVEPFGCVYLPEPPIYSEGENMILPTMSAIVWLICASAIYCSCPRAFRVLIRASSARSG